MKKVYYNICENICPSVILIRPQLGDNIGAVARAMLNFGLSDLRVVCPRDGWPNQQAIAVASGAGVILDNARLFNTTAEACADLHYVFATTARKRGLCKEIYCPENAVIECKEILNAGNKVGIMFGPERSGLLNEDVSLAQAIISVPINPKFSSLNLAQCVVIVAYHWFIYLRGEEVKEFCRDDIQFASLAEVANLRLSLLNRLSASNYFWPEEKKVSLIENLTNLLSRLPLTTSDVKTLHGVIKALSKGKKNH